MTTTKGLWSLTAAANTLQARADWAALAERAREVGVPDDKIDGLTPAANAGWRTIDKRIAELRREIELNEAAQAIDPDDLLGMLCFD